MLKVLKMKTHHLDMDTILRIVLLILDVHQSQNKSRPSRAEIRSVVRIRVFLVEFNAQVVEILGLLVLIVQGVIKPDVKSVRHRIWISLDQSVRKCKRAALK